MDAAASGCQHRSEKRLHFRSIINAVCGKYRLGADTGKKYPGYATYLPVVGFHGVEPTALREGHNLKMVTHRTITQTKSRTSGNQWLTPIMPENAILIHPDDAAKQSLATGDEVMVVSATNPEGNMAVGDGKERHMIGRVCLTQTVRPGVVSFCIGFGHWATGASDIEVNGQIIKGDPRRDTGIHANAALWVDPTLKNTCFFDPVGGSVSFYDTHIKLMKKPGALAGRPKHLLKAV